MPLATRRRQIPRQEIRMTYTLLAATNAIRPVHLTV
jgi:hypothetical protein